jgi:glutathione S-transferase
LFIFIPGLYGASNDESTTIDVILGAMDDFSKHIIALAYEKDEARKAELKKDLEENILPHYMNILEDILKENDGGDGFFVGKTVSVRWM